MIFLKYFFISCSFILSIYVFFVSLVANSIVRLASISDNGLSYIFTALEFEAMTLSESTLSNLVWNVSLFGKDNSLVMVQQLSPDYFFIASAELVIAKSYDMPYVWLMVALFLLPWAFVIFYQLNKHRGIKRANEAVSELLLCCELPTEQVTLPIEDTEKLTVFEFELLNTNIKRLKAKFSKYQMASELHSIQDKLTGLIERHAYLQYLEHQLVKAKANNQKKSLLFIDLDGFKRVNDAFGHSFGDEILVLVAQRLRDVSANNGLVNKDPLTLLDNNICRLGGDEFSFFIDDDISFKRASEISDCILKSIERDFILGNKVIKISASIGIALFPDTAENPYTLLQMADVAMYRAKSDGRGIYKIYTAEMGQSIRRYHYLMEELRLALINNKFSLHFQPIVNTDDCSISYFEALVRWEHHQEGFISPAEFIPIAERSNMILELGDWVMEEACRQMAAWYKLGLNNIRISVNISGIQLKYRSIDSWVLAALKKANLAPSSLMLEITESSFVEPSVDTITQLARLRAIGVLVAIDDFGTGFSSFSTLAELPVDVLKIDKIFIDQACDSEKYYKVLNSVSQLGHQLGLKLVCEGVENVQQFNLVKDLNIDCVQGYYISCAETAMHVGLNVIDKNINLLASSGTTTWFPAQQI